MGYPRWMYDGKWDGMYTKDINGVIVNNETEAKELEALGWGSDFRGENYEIVEEKKPKKKVAKKKASKKATKKKVG